MTFNFIFMMMNIHKSDNLTIKPRALLPNPAERRD